MARNATLKRTTRETDIDIALDLDGSGVSTIQTGVGFFDHMLELFSKHSLIDLEIKADGDLQVDYHHTVEDVGLALGECLNTALGDRTGITRYGWSLLPMDDALSRVAVDLGGRPFLVWQIDHPAERILEFDLLLFKEFFRAVVTQARMNLHVAQLYGEDPHHAYESVFKGWAKAMKTALEIDPRVRGVPSSKGAL